jgi:hypothetical protein
MIGAWLRRSESAIYECDLPIGVHELQSFVVVVHTA